MPWTPGDPGIELLALVVDLGVLFALLGIYLPRGASLGRAGLLGFVTAVSGVASIVGPDTSLLGVDGYVAGVAVLSVGHVALGGALLRSEPSWRPAALCWLGSVAIGALGGVPGIGARTFVLAGVLFGAGYVAAGLRLLRG